MSFTKVGGIGGWKDRNIFTSVETSLEFSDRLKRDTSLPPTPHPKITHEQRKRERNDFLSWSMFPLEKNFQA